MRRRRSISNGLSLVIAGAACGAVCGQNVGPAWTEAGYYANRGQYFAQKTYERRPLPKFEETRGRLPNPVYDEDPACVAMYWKAWELAFRHFYEPPPGSGFVSQFIDAAFNQNIFLWDTCFMTMFCNYAHPHVPGIVSLDNFYCKQFPDGEICREIDRATGREFAEWVNRKGKPLHSRWGVLVDGQRNPYAVTYVGRNSPPRVPYLTLDALNHPILAWAELESFRLTADRSRLMQVYPPLVHYYRALREYLRQGNGLYMTDWASMDDSPRNPYLVGGGTGVDISAQMVLFARNLAEIADLLEKPADADAYRADAERLAGLINEKMWDARRGFYFDLTVDGKRSPVRTVAAYWTLLAGVAGPQQVSALVAELRNPRSFGRMHRVPTVPGDEKAFDPAGGYWKGAVWEPVNTMVVRGLEKCGQEELAAEIAREHLRIVTEIFRKTHTVWENYAPDAAEPGKPAKQDFVGWSGLGPILYLIEYGIGIKVDAPSNLVTWHIRSPRRVGIERLWFNGRVASFFCDAPGPSGERKVHVESTDAFRLRIVWGGTARDYDIRAGGPLGIALPATLPSPSR